MRSFTRNFLIAFFLCSLATLLALSRLNYPLSGIDDANIYFVYARNLANGHVFFLIQTSVWAASIRSEMDVEFDIAEYGRKNGTFIQELFSSLPKLLSMGVVTSGGIKYSYDGEIVDLMGLNNTIMAHNHGDRTGIKNHAAFDIDTFHQLQPDIVWPVTIYQGRWQYIESEVPDCVFSNTKVVFLPNWSQKYLP